MNTAEQADQLPTNETRFLEGGRYELLERIGRGSAGDVYRARECGLVFPREVCIKRLALVSGPEQVRAMREEARLLARVRHSNVVSLLAMGEEPGNVPFLVLELVRGWNLRTLCRRLDADRLAGGASAVPPPSDGGRSRVHEPRGPNRAAGGSPATGHGSPRAAPEGHPALPAEWMRERSVPAIRPIRAAGFLPDLLAVHVVCGVLRALGAVQRAVPGLVHRDVTPHNVLVSKEGEVKLTDFGIALALDRTRWTRPRFIKGKFGFMAPEQIRGERLDLRTDLFAVGVTLYELLTRTRPWGTLRPMEELHAIESGDIAPISTYRPKLDRSLCDAVDRLLAWRMKDRFSSFDDALRALAPHSAGDLGPLRLTVLVASASMGECEATGR